MALPLVQELIDSGIHFGHKASRWNPKMKAYILGKRNTVHLIDIKETIRGLLRAKKFISQTVSNGLDILFVGTKRQAKMAIQVNAERTSMPFVNERWLGGTLTNFRTIRSRLTRLEELENLEQTGKLFEESKKTVARWTREKKKILRNLSGIRNMAKLPGALVIVDPRLERNAVLEAKKLGIKTIALIDTDSDPDLVDIPVPGNDDAIRAIEIIVSQLADAVADGKRMQPADRGEQPETDQKPRKRSRRPTTSQLAGQPEQAESSTEEPAGEQTPPTESADNQAVAAVAESGSTSNGSTENQAVG